ncbi:Down syndrome cell adhesion molecule-like protein 1 [Portunus trituberculatus]|uniref:Down syndrome cell adhesion molecule-like protein 1 n=1 Tax=Portunus trituberculatus TaxID=210409 RepID=A0A5B7GU22_PORTR|nr:Down syndrome cell adhesion molecule-like protein 1 [Portunus trituberculatus]
MVCNSPRSSAGHPASLPHYGASSELIDRSSDTLNHQLANRAVVQRDGTLSLSDLQRDDGGLYTCTATNRHGHDSALYHLNVLVPPSPPSLHVIETTTSSVRVQWNVEDTGGATIQGSSLHYRSGFCS